MKKKAVLLSLNSQWVRPIFWTCEKIFEVRKRVPLLEPPYDVYVYVTKKDPQIYYESILYKGNLNGLIVGKFTCAHNWERNGPWTGQSEGTCLTDRQLAEYANGEKVVFMEISNPVRFELPIGIGCFGVERAPQNFQYIEVEDE